MNTMDQVDSLRNRLIVDGVEKPEIVRQIAEACLGWPYVFGAWGEECSPSNRKKRKSDEHPTIVSKCQVLSGKKSDCHGCQWYPDDCRVRMYDCRGFTAWLVRQVGLDLKGQGATSQYNTASNWTQKGPIAEMPDVVCCVFKANGKTMEHTGMHVGGGKIIHCSSNVQVGKTTDKGWTNYAIPVGLNDSEPDPSGRTMEIMYVTAKSGSTVRVREKPSKDSRILMELRLGTEVLAGADIDGWRQVIYGGTGGYMMSEFLTYEAYQSPDVTYKVICEGMTFKQVQKIRETCPTAYVEKE